MEVQLWPRRSLGRRACTRRQALNLLSHADILSSSPLVLSPAQWRWENGGEGQIPGEGLMMRLYQRRFREGIMLPNAQSVPVWPSNCASAVPVLRLCLCRTTARKKYLLLRDALLLLHSLFLLLFVVKACRWYLVCALHCYLLMLASASTVNRQLPPRLLL